MTPRGVIIIEPGFAPGVLDPTRVTRQMGEAHGIHVDRISRLEIDSTISRLYFDYEITDATGTRRVSEVHELGLFSTDELRRTFQEAGHHVEYDPKGLTNRGLYLARVAA